MPGSQAITYGFEPDVPRAWSISQIKPCPGSGSVCRSSRKTSSRLHSRPRAHHIDDSDINDCFVRQPGHVSGSAEDVEQSLVDIPPAAMPRRTQPVNCKSTPVDEFFDARSAWSGCLGGDDPSTCSSWVGSAFDGAESHLNTLPWASHLLSSSGHLNSADASFYSASSLSAVVASNSVPQSTQPGLSTRRVSPSAPQCDAQRLLVTDRPPRSIQQGELSRELSRALSRCESLPAARAQRTVSGVRRISTVGRHPFCPDLPSMPDVCYEDDDATRRCRVTGQEDFAAALATIVADALPPPARPGTVSLPMTVLPRGAGSSAQARSGSRSPPPCAALLPVPEASWTVAALPPALESGFSGPGSASSASSRVSSDSRTAWWGAQGFAERPPVRLRQVGFRDL